jgi:hypothetical protein
MRTPFNEYPVEIDLSWMSYILFLVTNLHLTVQLLIGRLIRTSPSFRPT